MSKHTPGPWRAVDNYSYWQIDSDAHGQIGDACASKYIYVNGERLPRGEAEAIAAANARLIAAAPELLEALRKAERQLVAAFGEPADGATLQSKAGVEAIRQARAALAKVGADDTRDQEYEDGFPIHVAGGVF